MARKKMAALMQGGSRELNEARASNSFYGIGQKAGHGHCKPIQENRLKMGLMSIRFLVAVGSQTLRAGVYPSIGIGELVTHSPGHITSRTCWSGSRIAGGFSSFN